MNRKYVFYMDDFGTRTSCKGETNANSPAHQLSFALGGVIVAGENVDDLSEKVRVFCREWGIHSLHGNKIRAGKGSFGFLKKDTDKREAFFTELNELVLDDRLIAHACVICRPGYRDRYLNKYPDGTRWDMSKTAFDISVERAAKLAMKYGRQLNVVYERAGKKEDKLLEGYFASLKDAGMEFCSDSSKQYEPLTYENFKDHLNVIWADGKANPLLQLADLIVHPISHITSGKENRAYKQLLEKRMLLDFKLDDPTVAVKYSCFDGEYGAWQNSYKNSGNP